MAWHVRHVYYLAQPSIPNVLITLSSLICHVRRINGKQYFYHQVLERV